MVISYEYSRLWWDDRKCVVSRLFGSSFFWESIMGVPFFTVYANGDRVRIDAGTVQGYLKTIQETDEVRWNPEPHRMFIRSLLELNGTLLIVRGSRSYHEDVRCTCGAERAHQRLGGRGSVTHNEGCRLRRPFVHPQSVTLCDAETEELVVEIISGVFLVRAE